MGWYQKEHTVTNDLLSLCKGNRIIDVGAGATTLVQSLIDREFQVTVLDISSEALQILSSRHGDAINYNVLLCKQQYSEKNIAIKLDEIESIEEWNTDSLCVYMRSGTRLYVEGNLTDIFADKKGI